MERWLEVFGLEQYAEVFAANDIALEDLCDLSEDDLRELGLSLGHRKRLLRAVSEHAAGQSADINSLPQAAANWSRRAGERKPVTLLFADITGSTALTETLEAEDAHDRLYRAVQLMCEAIEAERGTVCRFMGDGVMAMFGAPISYEDHPVRACAAALTLQARMGEYADALEREQGCRIQVRVGLHNGEVVVLQVGSADKAEYDASGASVALAARMEQTARPGTIQMTASTYALVESHFEGETLQPVFAKGFDAPVSTVSLLRRRPVSVASMTVPFVGRRAELEQFRVLFDICMHEQVGRSVIIRGEPGIGKTRLAERAMDEARRRGFMVHRSAALDFGGVQGQDPARLLLRDLFGLDSDAADEQRTQVALDAIESGLVERDYRAHLMDLLNLPTPPDLVAEYAALAATERASQRAALLAQVVKRFADLTPRLLVIEDVHWAPPAVRAYIIAIARVLNECPALMLLTTRPEFDVSGAHWDALLDGLASTCHGVGVLTDQEAQELAVSFALNDSHIIAQCIERSGHNPLFLEQLLRSRVDNASAALPTSIQTLVAAQVDRLDELDKRAAQAAAVLGKQFDLAALRELIGRPDYECTALTEHRLVHAEGGTRMVFYHALVQEGVLSSLLRRDRQALHRLAANWFAGRDSVLHARHLDLAEDAGAPLAYLQAAQAEVSAHRFVFAMDHLMRGLQLVKDGVLEFQLRTLEGQVLGALGRAAESANAYRNAAALADDTTYKCRALLGAAEALRTTGEYGDGLDLLDDAQTLAASDNALALERAQIHYMRGNIYFLQMDTVRCEVEQKKAFELAKACRAPEMEALALTGLARTCFVAGRMNAAANHVQQYLQVCDEHGLEQVRFAQINMLGITLHHQLEADAAVEAFQASRDHAPRVGAPRQAIIGAALGANALLDFGRFDEAAEFARASIELSRQVGERRYEPIGEAVLIRAESAGRDAEEAISELRDIWGKLDVEQRAFSGWWALGGIMINARTAQDRRWAAEQASQMPLARSFGNGCLRFFHDAITASLIAGELNKASEFAARLEAYIGDDICPLTHLHLRWLHACTAGGEADILALRDEAQRVGLDSMVRNLERRVAN